MTALRERAGALLDLLYPRRCPVCDKVIGSLPFCPDCAPVLEKLQHNPPRLSPNDHDFMALSGAASAYHYKDEAAAAIKRCKYAGRPWAARELGLALCREVLGYTFTCKNGILVASGPVDYRLEYDLIVPVPPSDGLRGYGVPALIDAPVSRATGIPVAANALHKIRKTKPQASLGREERLTNLIGAFAAEGREVEGRKILLVDDIITTGATASACAIALVKAGAAGVFAVSVAAAEEERKK